MMCHTILQDPQKVAEHGQQHQKLHALKPQKRENRRVVQETRKATDS